ncbi:MAG: hypothetical protein J5881_03425 [Clostridia bacterium]|nr:hypothetical protein [Clostridia bacterium]
MLLILAGITINALTGSDSAPAKANEAEQQNDIGSAKDQIALTATNAKLLAYDTAYVGNGISSTEVSNSVGRAVIKAVAEQIQGNNQVGKATIEITGYGTLDNINNDAKITITTRDFTEKGTITIEDGILTWGESKADAVNTAIGQVVNYSANNVNSWRVFYADNKQMFIIPTGIAESNYTLQDTSVTTSTVPKGNATYTNYSDDVFASRTIGTKTVTYGLTYNSRWKEKLGNNKDESNRSIATAYMCDPANWTRYVANNAPDGTYAVGGPTKELLAAAWEQTKDASGNYRSAGWQSSDVEAGGYENNKPSGLYSSSPIQRTILPTTTNGNDGLFNNGTSYWLASPSSNDSRQVCLVDYRGYVEDLAYYGIYPGNLGLRPLVSIPLSHVNVTGSEGNYSVSLDFVED